MKLTGSYEIKSDKISIWKALNDPKILKKSIPGCEEFKKNSDVDFAVVATNKIGPFNATFTGKIELKDLNPPDSYSIVGQGSSPVGFASGEASVLLKENNGVTRLIYTVEANVGGKIAQVGSRLIDMTAKKMADIFFGNFSQLVTLTETKDDGNKARDIKLTSEKSFNFKKIVIVVITIAVLLAIYSKYINIF